MPDNIERTLGMLLAEAESSKNQRKSLFEKLDEIRDALGPLQGMPDHIRKHCVELDLLKGSVNRTKGAIWMAGIIGSVLGFAASNFKHLFKFLGGS
jgi:hypothetical protein